MKCLIPISRLTSVFDFIMVWNLPVLNSLGWHVGQAVLAGPAVVRDRIPVLCTPGELQAHSNCHFNIFSWNGLLKVKL